MKKVYKTYDDIIKEDVFKKSLFSLYDGYNENQSIDTLFATSCENLKDYYKRLANPKINIVLIKQLTRIQFSKKYGYDYYKSNVIVELLKGTENVIEIEINNTCTVALTYKNRLSFQVLTDENHSTPSTLTITGLQAYAKIAKNKAVIRPLQTLIERL